MKTWGTVLKFIGLGVGLVLLLFVAPLIFGHHSPTIDILGSYFPAWMVCILSGLTFTFVAHWIIQLLNLKPYIGPAPLIYSCLMIIFTFAIWILIYQN
jgi:hypothetical protein